MAMNTNATDEITAAVKRTPGTAEIQVWWIPQIPMKAFEFSVPSLEEGIRACEMLAQYDLFQYENKVKPDYANAGGIRWRHPEITDGEWWDIDPGDEDEIAEVRQLLAEYGGKLG
jgi:hypothetical protein